MNHGKGFIKTFLEDWLNSSRETMMKIDEAFLHGSVGPLGPPTSSEIQVNNTDDAEINFKPNL